MIRKKKKLGSYPFVSVVFTITLALFVIGVFGTLLIYSEELKRIVKDSIKVQVYLNNGLTEGRIKEIEKQLINSDFTLKNSQQSAVIFLSKEKATEQFIKDTGEDFQKFLGENPLRDAFLVTIDPAFQQKNELAKIKTSIEKLPDIFEVFYIENFIESINNNFTRISIILISVALFLLLAVILMINNVIRLALYSQRFLIRSMQLVGATKGFIIRPFILRALLFGIMSGAVACSLLWFIVRFGTDKIPELKLIEDLSRFFILLCGLFGMGIVVSVISTWRAVLKYLGLSLDELY